MALWRGKTRQREHQSHLRIVLRPANHGIGHEAAKSPSTAALEMLNEIGPLDALITPVGGGGLLAGCATIAKELNPTIRVFGAEPEKANDTFLSMQAGERVGITHP